MASEQATYSHGHHKSVVGSHARRTVEDSAAFLIPHVKPTHHILDLGCGPGSITIGLAKLVSEGKVIGGDAVEEVLDSARQLASQQDVTNLSFQKMDGNAMPFEDATFDITFCHQTLQHVANPVAILKEMRRVTRPGGIVAARDADYRSFAWFPEHEGLDQWGALYQKVAVANKGQPNGGRHLLQWAKQAGFASEDIQFTWSVWNYRDENAKAFGTAWIDRTLHSSFGTTAKQHGLCSDEDLRHISASWKEWANAEDNFIIIPNGEILCTVR